jgi:hypothetical protein
MPTLEEALGAAFDEATGTAANTSPDPATPPAGDTPPADSTSNPNPDPATPPAGTTPDPAATAPATNPATPSSPTGAGVDTNDLKAVKERVVADHPELEPVLNAALKEMERGLTRKFEQLSALKKEAAEQVVQDARLQGIDRNDLAEMAQWHRLAQTNPAAAADYLFQVSENLRQQSQNPAANPYAQLPPQVAQEMEAQRQFIRQQTQQQIVQQIDGEFTKLQAEFGGAAIPENQRIHVLEYCQKKNLDVEDIGVVWRAYYGAEYARQDGIKRGQTLRAQKEGLGAGSTATPPPSSGDNKPKNLLDALSEVCDSHGVR